MKKSDILKQKRASLLKEQGALIETRNSRKEGEKIFSEDETKKFNELDEEIRSLDDQIENEEKIEAAEARYAAAIVSHEKSKSEEKERKKIMKRYSLHKALRSQLHNGEKLEGVEKEIHEEISNRAKAAGITLSGVGIPTKLIEGRADAGPQTVTQDDGDYGGALVSQEQREVIDFLRPRPIVEQMGAQFLRNLEGDLVFPVNEGGIDASWEGEISKVDNTRNKYDNKSMKPKRLAATTAISLQNLFQSSIDLEAYTIKEINDVIALKIDEAAIRGTGANNQPSGILTISGTNPVGTGANGEAPTWDHIVQMETEIFIKNANAAVMGYLINPGTKGKLKTTKHTAGDLNYLMSMANEINGYRVGVTNLVPSNLTKGTDENNLSAAIFGDWTQLLIGEWGFKDITVDEFSRKREGLIEITINNFLDVMVKYPQAFSVVKNWKL